MAMGPRSRLALVGATLGTLGALVAALGVGILPRRGSPKAGPASGSPDAVPSAAESAVPLVHATVAKDDHDERPAALAGLSLTALRVDDDGVTAPAGDGRVAHLTLDPDLQRTTASLLAAHHLPEAAAVVMDVTTGHVLAYASHVEGGPARDLCVEASAPAASVFKIVTGSALVESAGLTPETRQCYSGGEQRIHASDLVENPARDRWCVTLADAMGRSVNTVFARLAQRHLKPAILESTAKDFAFGEALPFDVAVAPSALQLPSDPLNFARTAAGFWNTTLSPVAATWMSATVARGGEAVRPSIVRDVVAEGGAVLYEAPKTPTVMRRVLTSSTAAAVTTMMERTVAEGTSYKAFHDGAGTAFLPGMAVAGKTGTLTDGNQSKLFTWFTGFAPTKPVPGVAPVAVGVLVVNKPSWHVKANVVARDILRAYFAAQKVPNISKPAIPSAAAVARAERPARTKRR